jgi:predicted XRE-type DNA-binding protein
MAASKAIAKAAKKSTETFASVWDAHADTPEQAANLRARAELMQQIADVVKESGWTSGRGGEALRDYAAAHQ